MQNAGSLPNFLTWDQNGVLYWTDEKPSGAVHWWKPGTGHQLHVQHEETYRKPGWAIQTNASQVFWTSGPTVQAGVNLGPVAAAALAGVDAGVLLLDPEEDHATGLLADDTSVFWATANNVTRASSQAGQDAGPVVAQVATGGAARLVVGGPGGGSDVFILTALGELHRVASAFQGGQQTVFINSFSGGEPFHAITAGTLLVWSTTGGAIHAFRPSGQSLFTLTTSADPVSRSAGITGFAYQLAWDGQFLFYTTRAPNQPGRIYRLEPTQQNAGPQLVRTLDGVAKTRGLAVDQDHIFWSQAESDAFGSLMRQTKPDG